MAKLLLLPPPAPFPPSYCLPRPHPRLLAGQSSACRFGNRQTSTSRPPLIVCSRQQNASPRARLPADPSSSSSLATTVAGQVEETYTSDHDHMPYTTVSLQSWALNGALAIVLSLAQVASPLSLNYVLGNWLIGPAEAVLYSPDTKVPRSAEVALRKAIPAVNPAMKKIQDTLEDIFYLLRIPQRKPYGTMEGDVKKALKLATDEKASILVAMPMDQKEKGLELYENLIGDKGQLQDLINAIAEKDPDKVSVKLASSLTVVAQLELLQAPGLPYLLPGQFQEYPRLTGRATVEFVVERGDGSAFTVATGGGPQKVGTIEVVLDGYSAPLTSGNFVDLVLKGVYNGMKLRATEQAILSDNERNVAGASLPLEIMPAGEFQPLYRTTLNVQDGELPVLPLSVYGAVAMAHSPDSEDYSAPSQFFFYLYDRRSAGLGGLSFDEGQFSVFGYVTNGKEILSQLKTGDVIQSAKIVSGADRLVFPSVGSG